MLFMQAGLQDRVIQTYEGCMYMDFAQACECCYHWRL